MGPVSLVLRGTLIRVTVPRFVLVRVSIRRRIVPIFVSVARIITVTRRGVTVIVPGARIVSIIVVFSVIAGVPISVAVSVIGRGSKSQTWVRSISGVRTVILLRAWARWSDISRIRFVLTLRVYKSSYRNYGIEVGLIIIGGSPFSCARSGRSKGSFFGLFLFAFGFERRSKGKVLEMFR